MNLLKAIGSFLIVIGVLLFVAEFTGGDTTRLGLRVNLLFGGFDLVLGGVLFGLSLRKTEKGSLG